MVIDLGKGLFKLQLGKGSETVSTHVKQIIFDCSCDLGLRWIHSIDDVMLIGQYSRRLCKTHEMVRNMVILGKA